MKRWLTTTLFLVIVGACRAHEPPSVSGDGTPASPPSGQDRELRILTWNIYMLPGFLPKRQVERAEVIADSVAGSGYDILVFQEAFNHGAVRVIRSRLGSAYPYMYGPFNRGGSPVRFSSGVWVLSRIPLRLVGTIEFGSAKSFDRAARKGAALLEGEWNGRAFQLLGTHLQADDHPSVREAQFRELSTGLLLPFKREGVPQIICGDMNTESTREEEYRSMLEELCAEDGRIEGPQKTSYDARSNRLADKVWENTCSTVDYVLLRLNGALIRSVKRSIRVFKCPGRKGDLDLSDHYGVACTLYF